MKVRNINQISSTKPLDSFLIAKDIQFLGHLTYLLKSKQVYLSDYFYTDIGNTRHVTLKVLYGSKFFRNVSANFRGVKPLKRKLLSSERHRLKSRILTVTKLLKATSIKDIKTILKYTYYRRYLNRKLHELSKIVKQGMLRSVNDVLGILNKRFAFIYVKKSTVKSRIYVQPPKTLGHKVYTTLYKNNRSVIRLSHRGIVHKFKVSTKRIRLQNKDSLLSMRSTLVNVENLANTSKNVLFSVVPLNYLIRKDLYGSFYDSFQSFKFRLFSRNEDLYNDFVAVLTLLSLRNISITIFGVILARVVGSIHKRRHGLFISFLNILSKGVVSNLLSDISGVKMTFSGRIFGRDIAKTICVDKGSPELNTISIITEHTHVDAFTVYGVYGLKFWISFKKKPRTRLSLTLKEKKSLLRRLKNFKLKQKRLARVTLRFQPRSYVFSSKDQRILLSKDKKALSKVSNPKKKSDLMVAVREVSRKLKLQDRKARIRKSFRSIPTKTKSKSVSPFLASRLKKRKKVSQVEQAKPVFSLVSIFKKYRAKLASKARSLSSSRNKKRRNYPNNRFGKYQNKNYQPNKYNQNKHNNRGNVDSNKYNKNYINRNNNSNYNKDFRNKNKNYNDNFVKTNNYNKFNNRYDKSNSNINNSNYPKNNNYGKKKYYSGQNNSQQRYNPSNIQVNSKNNKGYDSNISKPYKKNYQPKKPPFNKK